MADGRGADSPVDLAVSHYMPPAHGTHRDFIAPWACAVEAGSGGCLRVTVHDGDLPLSSRRPLYVSPLYFVMNRARYDGLDPTLRGAIDAASGPALAERVGVWWEAWAGPAREAVQRRGNTVSALGPGERERWARAAQPALDRWLRALEADGVSEARAIYETASAMAGA